jgi:hypothetical protein
VIRETAFYVLPEFKSPVDKRTPTQKKEEASSPSWQWGDGGAETMHPFWAVRRLTATQLRKEQETTKLGQPQSRFNCELIDFQMSIVTIAAPKNKCMNSTRTIHMQLLTNSMPLKKGEELILEIILKEKKKAETAKRSWRDAQKDADRDAATAAATAKKAKTTAAPKT